MDQGRTDWVFASPKGLAISDAAFGPCIHRMNGDRHSVAPAVGEPRPGKTSMSAL
jgi:hypothetical protein